MLKVGAFLLIASMCLSQQQPAQSTNIEAKTEQAKPKIVATVPAGTRVLLTLLSPISSGSARAGNGVYMQTVTPITAGNETVIPPGSYVQGEVDRVTRPGKVKGRAELQIHFTSVTFPSGYHQSLQAAFGSAPADESATVDEKEGTIKEKGSVGKDTATVAGTTTSGALIGAIANGGKGAGIGAGIGGVVGIASVLLTRGNEVRMNTGDPIEMVLERPLPLEHTESQAGTGARRPMRINGDRQRPRRGTTFPVPGIPGVGRVPF